MQIIPDQVYGFIVDTNKYAGNFERQLAAWCTGHTSDTSKTTLYASKTTLPEGFFCDPDQPDETGSSVLTMPDAHGIFRPCSIFWTPKYRKFYSVLMYFLARPTPEEIEWLKTRALSFPAEYVATEPHWTDAATLQVEGFRLVQWTVTKTEEAV